MLKGSPVAAHPLVQSPRSTLIKDGPCARFSPLAVLSIGRNAEILSRRAALITSHSALEVRSLNPDEAEGWARSSKAFLWIFCSTVELPRLVYLTCSVRRYSPSSRLLLMQGKRAPGFESSLFHFILPASDDEEPFLDAVSRLSLGF